MASEAAARARAVLDTTAGWFPVAVPDQADTEDVLALAGVARCRRLLDGMLSVDDDLGGVFARTLFETWLHAIYVFLGRSEALNRLVRNDAIHVRRNAERFLRLSSDDDERIASLRRESEEVVRQPRVTGELDLASMAEKVRQLLADREQANSRFPVLGYGFLYGPESYMSAHGGIGAVDRQLIRGPDGHITIRGDGWEYVGADRRLDLATSMVGTLAARVAEAWEIDNGPLDDLLNAWLSSRS